MEENVPDAEHMLPISVNEPDDDESNYGYGGSAFLNTSQYSQISTGSSTDLGQSPTSSELGEEETISQFYEDSFAIHEDVSSSNITGHGSLNDTSTDNFFDTTLDSLDMDPPSSRAEVHLTRTRLMASQPRNLNNLPTAVYLQSIAPQTVTVNLIVGIISIPPPRKITTRRDSRTVHLVEMLVGDDTRAGFAINIWLPDPLPNSIDPTTAATVATTTTTTTKCHPNTTPDLATAITTHLRPRDIILIRNAALSSFRAIVYGQSLRRKGMTTIDLLHRNAVDSSDTCGAYSAREVRDILGEEGPTAKMKRVKHWVMNFVAAAATTTTVGYSGPSLTRNENRRAGDGNSAGGGSGNDKKRRNPKEKYLVSLPMDTQ